jgi:hypothetical protein
MKKRLSVRKLRRPDVATIMRPLHPLIKRLLFGAALAAVLTLTFIAYLRPSFIIDLANRIILCF